MKGERLGEFEEVVLLAAYSLAEDAYGVTIQRQLDDSIGRGSTIGAVYAALDRLERKRYLSSRVGGSTHERGGRRKRFFKITKAGVAALEAMRADREEMWSLVGGES